MTCDHPRTPQNMRQTVYGATICDECNRIRAREGMAALRWRRRMERGEPEYDAEVAAIIEHELFMYEEDCDSRSDFAIRLAKLLATPKPLRVRA